MSLFTLASTAKGVLSASARFFSSTSVTAFPKLKTHSGAKKRWTAMPNGKFKRAQAGHHHLNVTKSPGRKNRLGATVYSNKSQTARLHKLMPYA